HRRRAGVARQARRPGRALLPDRRRWRRPQHRPHPAPARPGVPPGPGPGVLRRPGGRARPGAPGRPRGGPMTLEADFQPEVRRVTWRQLLQSAVGIVIAVALIAYGLPRVAQTTWTEIWHQFTLVSGWSAALLLGLMLAGLYCYTFTLIGSLPGLTHLR